MGNVTDMLLDTEASLESMVEASGKTIPKPGQRYSTVEHLDYIINLLGTMVSKETYKAVKKKMANGFNAINDRVEIINYLLSSGEISGDVDIEPITITENGEYTPGAGHAFGRVTVSTPEAEEYGFAMNTSGAITLESNPSLFSLATEIYGNSISFIGSSAFFSCHSLASVNFPVCTDIGYFAFGGCASLTSVSFPACMSIESYAFGGCTSLASVDFPACTYIGDGAFTNCRSLTSISFPVCTYIGGNAFANCSSLTSVDFPACTSIESYAFVSCSSLTSANFPACSSIGDFAFNSCRSLISVSFPSCTNIEDNAFRYCYNLVSLYLLASSVCVLYNSNAFLSTPIGGYSASEGRYGSVFVPASLVDAYKTATNWSYFSDRITAYTE